MYCIETSSVKTRDHFTISSSFCICFTYSKGSEPLGSLILFKYNFDKHLINSLCYAKDIVRLEEKIFLFKLSLGYRDYLALTPILTSLYR